MCLVIKPSRVAVPILDFALDTQLPMDSSERVRIVGCKYNFKNIGIQIVHHHRIVSIHVKLNCGYIFDLDCIIFGLNNSVKLV